MRAVKHTHVHTCCCSSLPDRKCGLEHNVTSHNLTFTTYRLWRTHSRSGRVQMQKSVIFRAQERFLFIDLHGAKMFAGSNFGAVWFGVTLSSSCQSSRRVGYASFGELHRDKQLFLTQNHLASTLIPVKWEHAYFRGCYNKPAELRRKRKPL